MDRPADSPERPPDAPDRRPDAPDTRSLVLLSAAALFAELALIRWLGCEVRIFAYFKNLVLIACFLGFGAGFLRARAGGRLDRSLGAIALLVAMVAWPVRLDWRYGPQIATEALSNFYGSIVMGDLPSTPAATWLEFGLGLAWTAALFLLCFAAMFDFARRIGGLLDAFGPERRLEAYTWNVAGSLAGIVAFSLVAWMTLPPLAWFLLVVLAAATVPGHRAAAAATAAALLVTLLPGDRAVWSPYHKLEVGRMRGGTPLVTVNGTGYMSLLSFVSKPKPEEAGERALYGLPYRLHPRPRRVLIVGAGGGNDIAAALAAGVERVVAIEIDPQILAIGRALAPDRPYSDPRVVAVLDDARHYVETTSERFDLIVYGHLDSHTALSGFTNIRLDNYIHTVEAFAACRRLLLPGGALHVSFWATQGWVAARLEENLRRAFGRPPLSYSAPEEHGTIQARFLASDEPGLLDRARGLVSADAWRFEGPTPPASTDDWPYLFVEKRTVPAPMLLVALPLLLVCGGLVALVARAARGAASGSGAGTADAPHLDQRTWAHFFLLGAAFLLVEVHNVSRLARLFGTTWTVNAWVVGAVLLAIVAANLLAARLDPGARRRAIHAGLILSLLAGAILPTGLLEDVPGGAAFAVVLFSLPILFSGIVFAWSFRAAADAPRALGANVLGSVLGGFLELLSFFTGLPGLALIAAALYAAALRLTPKTS